MTETPDIYEQAYAAYEAEMSQNDLDKAFEGIKSSDHLAVDHNGNKIRWGSIVSHVSGRWENGQVWGLVLDPCHPDWGVEIAVEVGPSKFVNSSPYNLVVVRY